MTKQRLFLATISHCANLKIEVAQCQLVGLDRFRWEPRGAPVADINLGFAKGAMARRTTRPLAYGEYGETGYARDQLLETVKRVYPEFLEKLAVDVFPSFKRMADAGFRFDDVLYG